MLVRESAEDDAFRIRDVEHVLDIEHEPVEPSLAHKLGLQQELAACAPDVGDRKSGHQLSKAKPEHRPRDARVGFEQAPELGRRGLRLHFKRREIERAKRHTKSTTSCDSANTFNTDST